MTSVKVSVLLPTRNDGALLGDAVQSILTQTLQELELIVIDDGCSDGSTTRLPTDPRLRLLYCPGSGIVDALNAGAAVARAPYLARMDGDDLALPQRLARQIALLDARPELGVVAAEVEIFCERGKPAQGYRLYQQWVNGLRTPEQIRREIFIESPIPHPSAVIRSTVFERLGGYRDVPWPEDYDLWLRAYAAGVAMAKPHGSDSGGEGAGPLLRWRDRPARLSRRDPRYGLQAFARAKAHYLAKTLLRDRAAVIWGAAPTGARLCDALREEGVRVSAFIDVDEKKIGGRKRGLPVLPWQAAARLDGELILGAVGSRGARADIRQTLLAFGKTEGVDFSFTA